MRQTQRGQILSARTAQQGGHRMATSCYQHGCATGPKVCGKASSPAAWSPESDAWIVNFNNGNANTDNRDNDNRVRAVRSVAAAASECQGAVALRDLYAAWRRARRKKVPSANQLQFEGRWLDGLLQLQEDIRGGNWKPKPSSCFIAQRPKAREIHAPDFGDRVVHHWLVPQIERIYEPRFIADSFSNRVGRGTHAAVARLQEFSRQVHDGEGGGWFLQLDVSNFFNSIHRPTLWLLLKRRMQRHQVPIDAQRVAHALLAKAPRDAGVIHCCSTAERALVPAHKRLENAAPGCGLPIGNLSSQFFANVYLDQLDQFVKHTLKARRYVRYVDDFVLIHHDRAQLLRWRDQIVAFLRDRLRLELKADERLQPLAKGVDFLGYVVRPHGMRVRARVVQHARAALGDWQVRHVLGDSVRATPIALRAITSVWHSYLGHFAQARAAGLAEHFHQRFPWLDFATRRRRFAPQLDSQQFNLRVHT